MVGRVRAWPTNDPGCLDFALVDHVLYYVQRIGGDSVDRVRTKTPTTS